MATLLNPAAIKTLHSQHLMYYYTSVIQSIKYQIYKPKAQLDYILLYREEHNNNYLVTPRSPSSVPYAKERKYLNFMS
jgi:hypothetical protein